MFCKVIFIYELASEYIGLKGFGYVDFETVEEAQEALSKDRHLIDGRPMYVSENKPHEKGQRNEFRYPTTLEKNKLFVNNVHYDATSEQVKVYSSIVFRAGKETVFWSIAKGFYSLQKV